MKALLGELAGEAKKVGVRAGAAAAGSLVGDAARVVNRVKGAVDSTVDILKRAQLRDDECPDNDGGEHHFGARGVCIHCNQPRP